MRRPEPPALDHGRLDRAFEHVGRQVADARTRYAALAVARRGGTVRSEAWLAGERLDAPRRSAVASITKPITATAVLQLVEDGRLVLTEPLSSYLPEFRPAPPPDAEGEPEPITAWHILTHTSGLPDAPSAFFDASPPTLDANLARLYRERLQFLPGSAYAYASDSFYLLAELIGRLSGLPYPAYLEERILGPLRMTATTFDPRDPGPAALRLEGSLFPAGVAYEDGFEYFVSLAMPGGGLWSTADDVARFGRAMLGGGCLDEVRVLGRPFVELMTRIQTRDVREVGSQRRPDYGLGWGRPGFGRGQPVSRSTFSHAGASGSMLIVDPDNDLVVVYLRNDWGAPPTLTEEAVAVVYAALDG